MEPFKHSVTINNKKYEYTIKPINKRTVFFECPGAHISQEFLASDIPALLVDLPDIILSLVELQKKQDNVIRFRVSSAEKNVIQKKAAKAGYPTISAFMRGIALGA
jgi:hypothetical protein